MIEFNTPGPRDTEFEKSPSSLFLQRVQERISNHCVKGDERDSASVLADLFARYLTLPDKEKSTFPVSVNGVDKVYTFTQRSRALYELRLRVKEAKSAVKTAQKGGLLGNVGRTTPEQAKRRVDMYKKLIAMVTGKKR